MLAPMTATSELTVNYCELKLFLCAFQFPATNEVVPRLNDRSASPAKSTLAQLANCH